MKNPPAMDHTLALIPAHAAGAPTPEVSAPPQVLSLPSAAQPWRYAWVYGRAVVASRWGPHRLWPERSRHYSAPVQIGARLARRWRALFDVPARATCAVPLLANQSVGTLMQARLFADLGLNLRHVQHLQHRTVHHASVAACAKARDQRLSCQLQRVLRLGEDRVLVQLQTQAAAADGSPLSTVEDGFIVDGLPAADLAGLHSDRALLLELLGLRRRLPRLSSTAGEALVSEMPVPGDMGRAYGRVSGDLGPEHLGSLGAWLCGLKRPCLQGLALRNLVVRHLAELGQPLQQLSLTFAGPAYLGEPLLLVVDGTSLEVHGAKGRLVAFGCCAAPA